MSDPLPGCARRNRDRLGDGLHCRHVLAVHWPELMHWLEEQGFEQYFESALGGGTTFTERRPYRFSQTGKRGESRASCGPLYNAEGQIIGVTMVFRAYPTPDGADLKPLPWLRRVSANRAVAWMGAATLSFVHCGYLGTLLENSLYLLL